MFLEIFIGVSIGWVYSFNVKSQSFHICLEPFHLRGDCSLLYKQDVDFMRHYLSLCRIKLTLQTGPENIYYRIGKLRIQFDCFNSLRIQFDKNFLRHSFLCLFLLFLLVYETQVHIRKEITCVMIQYSLHKIAKTIFQTELGNFPAYFEVLAPFSPLWNKKRDSSAECPFRGERRPDHDGIRRSHIPHLDAHNLIYCLSHETCQIQTISNYSVLNTSILVSRLTVKLALRRQVWVEILSVSQQALRGLLRTVQGS